MKERDELSDEKFVSGVFEESCLNDTMSDLQSLLDLDFKDKDKVVSIYSNEFYDEVKEFVERHEVRVETKYKSVAKMVKSVVLPVPLHYEVKIEKVLRQPHLRDARKIGYGFIDMTTLNKLKVGCEIFLTEIENECFREMFLRHRNAFAFKSQK